MIGHIQVIIQKLNVMPNFEEYYKELLEREGFQQRELISIWDKKLISEISQDFEQAVASPKFIDSLCAIRENSSNQSVGNQIEVYAIDEINEHLKLYKIEKCAGSGYPDRILAKDDFRHIALEMKATSGWNPNDSNRRVLTSSSKKIRDKFIAPIYHLICTIIYQNSNQQYQIKTVRLDFIEPHTSVSIRLEAAVSHKLLENKDHESKCFPEKSV